MATDVCESLVQESERLSTEEMTAAALEVLRRLFGESVPEPTASIATKWGSDTYARGKPQPPMQGYNPPFCSTCGMSPLLCRGAFLNAYSTGKLWCRGL